MRKIMLIETNGVIKTKQVGRLRISASHVGCIQLVMMMFH
jgi:hypothetical protein